MPGPPPKMRESQSFKPQPHPTMWLGRGPGCRRPSNPWAVSPNSPRGPAPACRVGPRSPVSCCSLPHSNERASECNEAPEAASGARFWGPRSAMEAMSQSGRPRKSGEAMQPAPLTSGGLALGEITCRGWAHTYSIPS